MTGAGKMWDTMGVSFTKPEIDELSKEWCDLTQRMQHHVSLPLSILTGKSPSRHGVTQWLKGTTRAFVRKNEKPKVFCPISKSPGIKESEITLGETFQQAGYETAFYGKWHLGPLQATGGPKNHGFDSQKAIIEANKCEMFYPFAGKGYFPDAKKGDNFTDLLTDASSDFIKQKREKPFYLHLCHFAMHAPICSKPEESKKFLDKAAALPKLEKDRKTDPYAHKPQKLRQDSAEYAGELATLDTNIGKIVNALKESGQYENTIIVLTGDNEEDPPILKLTLPATSLLNRKTFLYEGGSELPCSSIGPTLRPKASKRTHLSPAWTYPTLLEMAGLEAMPGQHLDGVSLFIQGRRIPRPTSLSGISLITSEGSIQQVPYVRATSSLLKTTITATISCLICWLIQKKRITWPPKSQNWQKKCIPNSWSISNYQERPFLNHWRKIKRRSNTEVEKHQFFL